MSFDDTMNTMLPTQDGATPHVTGDYGEQRSNGPHGGTDFNYEGGQNGVNMTNPTVNSPVDGTVTFTGGNYGTIKIRDSDGNSHEILHTDSQNVSVGDQVSAGDPIGTMGGRGPEGSDQYSQHIHYQLKDPEGNRINPQEWWDGQGDGDGDGGESPNPFPFPMPIPHPSPAPRDNTDGFWNWRPRRDPLVLDLDGDGIESVGTTTINPILFDHDGDGLKTGTGWVLPDDGFLVLDRDGNGAIDSGAELF